MVIDTVLFDFDGTLAELHIDFSEMKRRVADIAALYSKRHPKASTMPVLEWIDTIAQELRDGSNGLAQAFRSQALAAVEAIEMEAAVKGNLFSFTRPMLEDLTDRGVKVAVVTRNCAKAVRTVFPDANRYSFQLFARDHVHRVKPHPDHLHTALSALGASPDHALMIGDHPLDIETGKRVGLRTAGVASGRISFKDLHACHPDWVAHDCEALIQILDAQKLLPGKA
ncbi:MAG: HAD family hydrolase [Desulfosoma sp.]